MAWIVPKTDWTAEYCADYEDFNRITGNLNHIKEISRRLFSGTASIGVLDDSKNNLSLIYASEMNAIENTLESLNINTYVFDIGKKSTYRANGSTPLWSEFNRIESATLLLYETIMSHKKSLTRLAFTLGRQKGITG